MGGLCQTQPESTPSDGGKARKTSEDPDCRPREEVYIPGRQSFPISQVCEQIISARGRPLYLPLVILVDQNGSTVVDFTYI